MRFFSAIRNFNFPQLPSESYFIGLLLSISFGLFYECTVPGLSNDHLHPKDLHHEHKNSQDEHHGRANEFMHQTDVKKLAARFDDPLRDKWQKPEIVIQRIQNLIKINKIKSPIVWEIGAGSGYFSTKFVKEGWTTIAADPNSEFLKIMETKKASMSPEERNKFFLEKIPYNNPGINRNDINIVFTSNSYHHIENRPAYFRKVKGNLANNGFVVILDFEKGKSGMGPPPKMRLTPKEVMGELKKAGFNGFRVETNLFPYHFLLFAVAR